MALQKMNEVRDLEALVKVLDESPADLFDEEFVSKYKSQSDSFSKKHAELNDQADGLLAIFKKQENEKLSDFDTL